VLSILVVGAENQAILKSLATEFESTHPNTKVKISGIPEDVYQTKLATSVLAKNPPDIAVILSKSSLIDFQPLDDILYASHDLPLADYNVGVLQGSCGLDGKIMCMGGNVGGLVLAYNKDVFTNAGIPLPSATTPMTMTEYATLAKQLTGGETKYGGLAPTLYYQIDPGTFMDETGRTAQFTTDPYSSAFKTMVGMVADGTAPSTAEMLASGSDTASLDLFVKKQIAMIELDSGELQKDLSKQGVTVGLAPMPVPDGTEPWISVWTNALGIPNGAKNVSGAADFLALVGTSGQKLYADAGQLPLRISDAETFVAAGGEVAQQFQQLTLLARSATFTPNMWAWVGVLDDAFLAVQRGDTDADSALADAQQKAQKTLDTTWKEYDKAVAAQ
jgi:ABC-type glycerol-3-phosphate transport system substrate-binding protein